MTIRIRFMNSDQKVIAVARWSELPRVGDDVVATDPSAEHVECRYRVARVVWLTRIDPGIEHPVALEADVIVFLSPVES